MRHAENILSLSPRIIHSDWVRVWKVRELTVLFSVKRDLYSPVPPQYASAMLVSLLSVQEMRQLINFLVSFHTIFL